MTPADIINIYNVSPLYKTGFTGDGQRIAVVGQSSIIVGDISRFRAAAGLADRTPTLVLVPGTGTPIRRSGDELESDIDLEYAGTAAPDADVVFVYTGSNSSASVYDALVYSIDENIAPVISISYGQCEQWFSQTQLRSLEQVLLQANSQGQTVITASGDQGATGCEDEVSGEVGAAIDGLGVQYPASSQYVTAVGGTLLADQAGSWNDDNSTGGGSAQGYIPEQGWNESKAAAPPMLLGSGGGFSLIFPKPSWQNAPGVPPIAYRAVPDIAIDAGVHHDSYIYCSSDNASGSQESCTAGFSNGSVAGGTSFGAPIVAGIMALVNQMSAVPKQGNINPRLYALAASVPGSFHDITAGDNKQPCLQGSKDCLSGSPIGYSATQGYDLVTGLGSPNAEMLVNELASPAGTQAVPTTVTIQSDAPTVVVGHPVSVTATVSSAMGVPTGTVAFSINGRASMSPSVVQSGYATYTFTPSAPGTYTITALFNSDSGFASASANLSVTAPDASRSGTIILSGSQLYSSALTGSLAQITATAIDGYSGVVRFYITTNDEELAREGCYAVADANIQGVLHAQAKAYVARSNEQCSALALSINVPLRRFTLVSTTDAKTEVEHVKRVFAPADTLGSDMLALCGVFALCPGMFCKRKWLCARLLLFAVGVTGMTGCGTAIKPDATPTGTYLIRITGMDTSNPNVETSLDLPITLY